MSLNPSDSHSEQRESAAIYAELMVRRLFNDLLRDMQKDLQDVKSELRELSSHILGPNGLLERLDNVEKDVRQNFVKRTEFEATGARWEQQMRDAGFEMRQSKTWQDRLYGALRGVWYSAATIGGIVSIVRLILESHHAG